MRVSKETVTKVANGDTLVGEVIESGGHAIVRMHGPATRNKSPLEISGADWQVFAATVRLMDHYVPSSAKVAPRPKLATVAAAAAAKPARRPMAKLIRIELPSGAHSRVSKHTLTLLRKLCERDGMWSTPKQLALGVYAGKSMETLVLLGLAERTIPFAQGVGIGNGKRGQYRVTSAGRDVAAVIGNV